MSVQADPNKRCWTLTFDPRTRLGGEGGGRVRRTHFIWMSLGVSNGRRNWLDGMIFKSFIGGWEIWGLRTRVPGFNLKIHFLLRMGRTFDYIVSKRTTLNAPLTSSRKHSKGQEPKERPTSAVHGRRLSLRDQGVARHAATNSQAYCRVRSGGQRH